MTAITIELSADETARLEALAAHEGETPGALAARTIRDRLADDRDWEDSVNAAIAEVARGEFLTIEEFDAHMDSMLAEIERRP